MPRNQARLQKGRQPRPTSCVVCGDAAAGYNYDAPSCPSCKAFFRRAVIKKEAFLGCARFGVCATIVTGLPCRSCRFERCIKGGMNQLLVNCMESINRNKLRSRQSSMDGSEPSSSRSVSDYSPESTEIYKTSAVLQLQDRDEKDIVILKNQQNRGDSVMEANATLIINAQRTSIIAHNPVCVESKLENMMMCLISIEDAHQRLRISTYSPQIIPGMSIHDFVSGPSKLGNKYGPMHTQPYEAISMNLIPIEVIIKKRVIMELPNFDYSTRKLWHVQDIAYSIEFIKALSVYQLLEDNTKRALIGAALLCSDFTTAFYSYSHQSDRTCYPDGSVLAWNKDIQEESPHSARFNTLLIAVMREAELDGREYLLLKTIVVCNPMIDGVHQRDIAILQLEKERCAKTLFSHILARRGLEEGPRFFAKILSIIDVATRLNSWQKSQHILAMALGLYKNVPPFLETVFHSS